MALKLLPNYLTKIRFIADELTLIDVPIKNEQLLIYTLNGLGPEFKEIAAVVRARYTFITFDELHDKLVEYEAYLKRKDLVPLLISKAGPDTGQPGRSSRAPCKKGTPNFREKIGSLA